MSRRDAGRYMEDRHFVNAADELVHLSKRMLALGPDARRRAHEPVADGYPRRSMPEGGGSGESSAVENLVLALAAGDKGPDTWDGIRDPIGALVKELDELTARALEALRAADRKLRALSPEAKADASREVCRSCGLPRSVLKDWNQALSMCGADAKRRERHTPLTPVRGITEEQARELNRLMRLHPSSKRPHLRVVTADEQVKALQASRALPQRRES